MLSAAIFQRGVWRAVPVFLSFLLGASAGAQTDQLAGTLPEDYFPELKKILATAAHQSLQLVARELEVEQKDAQIYNASSQLLPHVNGEIHYDSNTVSRADRGSAGERSRQSGLFYSLGVDQPIFHWGELRNNTARARIAIAIEEKRYVEAWRVFAIDLRRQYLLLISKKMTLRATRYAQALLKRDFDATHANFLLGKASGADEAGQRLNLDDNQLLLDRAEADFAADRRHFARLAGIEDLPEDAIPGEIPAPLYKGELAGAVLAAMLRDGGKSTFEAKVAELEIRSADLSYSIARVRLLPKFNLGAGYSLQNATNASTASVSQTAIAQENIQLNAHWPIFDGFATKGAKLEARVEKRKAEARFRLAAEAALESAQKLARVLPLDVEAMRLADERRSGGEYGFKRALEEKELGHAAQREVDDRTRDLYYSEAKAGIARAAFLVDWTEFVSLAAGDPALNNLPTRYVREKR